MTLTNHLLAGSLIGKYVAGPLAFPLALASHFMLDALPHFGFSSSSQRRKYNKLWYLILALDFLIAISISAWLIHTGKTRQLVLGLVAYSPDLLWIYRYAIQEKFGKLEPTPGGRFVRFHMGIQKHEFVGGIVIEVCLAIGLLLIVNN